MSKKMRKVLGSLFAGVACGPLAAAAGGCASETTDQEDGLDSVDSEISTLRDGVNSKGCTRSAYNCALNPGAGSQRASRADETWTVGPRWLTDNGFVDPATKAARVPVLDGNGELMALSTKTAFTLNHGQARRLKDRTWVMALRAGVGSAGWVPRDAFLHADSLRAKVGEVNGHGAGLTTAT